MSSYSVRYSTALATDSGISASALKMAIRTSFARFAAWDSEILGPKQWKSTYYNDHFEDATNNRTIVTSRQKVEPSLKVWYVPGHF